MAKGARSREYFGCVEWLLDAGVVSICHCLNFPELPLTGNYDESKYKLYAADTGLLIAMLDEEAGEDLRKNPATVPGHFPPIHCRRESCKKPPDECG